MTTKQAAALYDRAGIKAPADIAAPDAEYIRNTKRKMVDGLAFRSTLEANAYQILRHWQMAGAISELKTQPRFVLQEKFIRDGRTIRQMVYTADFQFVREGRTVVIEAKGFRTQPYMMRRKLFLAKYPEMHLEEWDREKVQELCRQ